MRYPAAGKLDIIRLVERSHRPAKWTLDKLGVPRRTFYRWYDRYLHVVYFAMQIARGEDGLVDRAPHPGRVWNKIPDNIRTDVLDMALDIPELSPRELAVRFTDTKGYFVSESSVYRLLKAHDLISSPAFLVMKAASEFKDKTTAINQLSLSALLRIACRAAGRQILRTSRLLAGAGCICRRYWMTSRATSSVGSFVQR